MNRAKALEHFEEHIAREACDAAGEEFDLLFREKKDLFIQKLMEGFQKIVRYLKETKDETEIGYIHYSFLRAPVLDGTYEWYVEAQDEKGVFDKVERSITIAMPEFFEPLERLSKNLQKQIHTYAGKITESDIDGIKLREFNRYMGYFYMGGFRTFQKLRQQQEYIDLKKAPLFRVTLGERKDKCIILHITFPSPMTKEEAWDNLYALPEENDMNKQELNLRDYSGFQFEDRRIVFKNTAYSSFQKIQMETCEAMFCNFIGCDFSGALIQDSYLNACTFQDTDFCYAVIQDTVMAANHFEIIHYEKGKRIAAGLFPVSFKGATLTNVKFIGSDLSGCDFTEAKLVNVDFTDAILKGTLFERMTAEQIELTQEQRESICVISLDCIEK